MYVDKWDCAPRYRKGRGLPPLGLLCLGKSMLTRQGDMKASWGSGGPILEMYVLYYR